MLNLFYTKVNAIKISPPESAERTEKESHPRRLGLDVMRAAAILMVVLYHSFPILGHLPLQSVAGQAIKKLRVFSDWFGPLGVDLFFVLSGFLIGSILIHTFLKSRDYNLNQVFNFWVRRWFRTIPNYFLMLTVAFLLYHYKYAMAFDWRYYIFAQNLFSPHPKFFGEAWSLAVEEWFYLTLPVFLLIFSKFSKNISKQQIIFRTIFAYLLTFIIIRLTKAYLGNYTDFDTHIRKIVVVRLDAVMYGVLLAYLMHFYIDYLRKIKWLLFFSGISIASGLTILFYLGVEKYAFYPANHAFRLFIDSSYFTLIPICFAMLLPVAYFFEWKKKGVFSWMVMQISLISYSMYLIHYALIYIPFFQELSSSPTQNPWFNYLIYWLLVLSISALNYHFFEKPVTKIRALFSTKE